MTPAATATAHSEPDGGLEVDLAIPDERWRAVEGVSHASVESAVRAAIDHAGWHVRGGAEISVVLGGDDLVRGLNREFRDLDRPTNVLSFALTEGDADPGASGGAPVMLGDVILAYDTVAREAREQSKSPRDHALHLVVHGVLHLIGYDHGSEAEARVMERMEQRILAELGIADPYLKRPPPA